ncbi:hypothetical protein D5086_030440 [Populus alba]|uniref:Uncharacterized protein n=1 Tax=Populus alba TaxID=43335 RepID=A0ACC4ANH9_POPAL
MEKFQILFPYASTRSSDHPVSSSMTDNSHNLSDFKADSTSGGFLGSKKENYHLVPRTSSEINKDLNSQGASFGIGSPTELKAAKKKGEKKVRKPREAKSFWISHSIWSESVWGKSSFQIRVMDLKPA